MPCLFPWRGNFLHFSGRENATDDGGIHFVLSLAHFAVVVFYLQHENRQSAFFVEIFLRYRHRQEPIQIVLAIGSFIAMLSDIPGEDADLVIGEG